MNELSHWISSWNNSATMWIWFIPVAIGTLFFALKMVKYAELLIDKTKLGGAFVGLVLVSMITSIPELITEISQGLAGNPSTGLSDDLGANAFSAFMLSIAIIIFVKSMFIDKLSFWTKITILIAFITTLIMTLTIYFGWDLGITKNTKIIIGYMPLVFMGIYLITTVFAYKFRHLENVTDINKVDHTKYSTKKISFFFVFYSLLLVVMAILLNAVIDGIQDIYKIDPKSAGGLMLSMTTAMPEVVALFSLARSNHMSAAVGAIIGSHIFNLSAVLWGDIAFSENAILVDSSVHSVWMISAIATIELFVFGIFVLIGKKIKNKYVYSILPAINILVYIVGWILILAL